MLIEFLLNSVLTKTSKVEKGYVVPISTIGFVGVESVGWPIDPYMAV